MMCVECPDSNVRLVGHREEFCDYLVAARKATLCDYLVAGKFERSGDVRAITVAPPGCDYLVAPCIINHTL
jgi:hypothetical protein